ncbi:hypothetical protein BDM02DRAFT_3262776 [Thelephora ganbajun]|uniref:Uncharacterized protein n=1 Tax=Thelephora ganbajun TaxID=370292 RepID=A0ACB6Z7Y2_THEGA|nr:hypothetical protein BDM02DRAFT_3262776 [Thelephora ganbajun]
MARNSRKSQHKRSPAQEAQTRWMRGFRHHRPSKDEVKAFQLANPSSDAHSKRKLMHEVAKEKRCCLNSERREKRTKGKLRELKGKAEELEMAIKVTSGENEALRETLEELTGRNSELKQEVRRLTARFNSRVRREPQKIETAVQRALSSVFVTQQTTYQVKTPDGIIQNWAWSVILHLICVSDVPAAKTWTAFSCITEGLGITVEGSWSARSAGRIVLEGALAVEEMIVEDFANALACTLSGDGATHKVIPYMSRWAVMIPPQGLEPKDRFLGITPELNHTAATQVAGFKQRIQQFCDDYNASPFGTEHYFDPRKIWKKMTGYLSDHAADQKKVFQELAKYHSECDLELRGEVAMLLEDPDMELEIEQILDEKGEEMFREVGGAACWRELPEEERLRLGKKLIRDAEICLGERVLERLPDSEKREAISCYWSGCGMHKDLNAVKEGVDRMSAWWEKAGKVPPVALTNKLRAQTGLGSEVCRSDRGGVKLTNLVSALVRHKDPKKGQQDRFRTFCRKAIGTEVCFPDTSNTRYQCYTYAAAEILQHHQLYLDFLSFLATTKTSTPGELNNMEENIQRGITDTSTFTEIIVLALYDYNRFKQHIQNIIDHPHLLVSPRIDSTVASPDGQPWQDTNVIHKIEKIHPHYPDLEGALIAFFQGALNKLEKFTEEFKEGSPLSKATPEEHWLAFRQPTNDRNEGSLGLLRCMYRRFSNIKFGQLNARLMSKSVLGSLLNNVRLNPDVHGYMKNMSDDRRCHLRGAARKVDQSHAFSNFREEYANANDANMARKQAATDQKKKNTDERLKKLREFRPILNLKGKTIESARVEHMKTQLRWHRVIGGDSEIPLGFNHFKKEKLWDTVNQAVKRHQKKIGHKGDSDQTSTYIAPDPAQGDSHTAPGPAPDDVPDRGQCSHSLSSPIVETTIDNVVLGAPFDKDLNTVCDTLGLLPIDSIITMAHNLQRTEPPHLRIEAGCVWDRDNWSCAYDAVFMSFWSIYRESSPTWQSKWRQQAPKWGNFLGAAFDSLLAMAQDIWTSQVALSQEFTSLREAFCDELSQINPTYFRRHGTVPASVCRILGHVFGDTAEWEPHLNQVTACNRCGISTSNHCSFSLLGSTQLLDGYLNESDIGPFLPLQTAVTRYIQHVLWEPQRDHCSTCSGPLRVESLSIPEMTWLWVELCDLVSPIVPSSRLVFGLQHQRRVYTLQVVIYHGRNHFTMRFSDQPATWWKYDGRWRFGAPHVDHIEGEVDLLENDDRRAAFLLYRQTDL